MKVTRLFDLLDHYKETFPDKEVALSCKREGKWINYSVNQYVEQANYVSSALLKLGVKKDDKIAIISSNRPEYNILDMGIMQIGAITVPIYPTISEADYNYILNHAEVKYVFSEGEELLRKIEHILPTVPTLKGIYTFVDRGRHHYLSQLLEEGKKNLDLEALAKIKSEVTPEDVCCIIYTSGTTGLPKGVMHRHRNIVSQIMAAYHIPSDKCYRALSFLPMCHAYEKMLLYLYQYRGISIYYAENMGTIVDNIKEVDPNIMTCVPRLLEKIFDKLYASGKKLPYAQKVIYYWALNLALKYQIEGRSAAYNAKLKLADKLIYKKWREAIGGTWDIVISGGSAIRPEIASFFSAIGMPVFEGYGLTETSPVISVHNREPKGRKIGTVGRPLEGIEVKVNPETSELLCRGHNIMKGYYKAPELTAEAIDADGWFHTGDTAKIDENGHVTITGRIKSIFKTSMGKYINPFLIEEKMAQSPFIDNIMVVGENQKFAAAIISPNAQYLKSWAQIHKIEFKNIEDLIKNSEVIARFRKEVNKYNVELGDYEKIKKFDIVPEEWSQKNGLLTPTLKVKRNKAMEFYKENIDKLFA
ncbi:MAG: long-chain fatty acid--CoA ligase [Paludibacteraceae bacterium]|nr:long-chain fatty acid--CoA ligase [Paludibacteraceae bacterium]